MVSLAQGLELTYAETAVSPKTILKLQLIPSRDAVYKMLCKRASLKEYSPGEARKKGRLATKAELEAAMHGNKKSWSSFIFGFFTSHKVHSPSSSHPCCDTPLGSLQFRGFNGLPSLRTSTSGDPTHRGGSQLPVPQLAVTMVDTETHKVLFVKVHRGKGLAAMDDGASSDPYAEITIGNHSCKTKVRTSLCAAILTVNGNDTRLGFSHRSRTKKICRPVRYDSQLSHRCVFPEASDLRMRLSGSQLAQLTQTPGRNRAQVIQETCDPEWEEVFYFPMQYLSLATDKMVCNLYDHDIGYHEFMGWAEVELAALPKLSQPSPKQVRFCRDQNRYG